MNIEKVKEQNKKLRELYEEQERIENLLKKEELTLINMSIEYAEQQAKKKGIKKGDIVYIGSENNCRYFKITSLYLSNAFDIVFVDGLLVKNGRVTKKEIGMIRLDYVKVSDKKINNIK